MKNIKELDKSQCKYLAKKDKLNAIMSFPFPWNFILFALVLAVPLYCIGLGTYKAIDVISKNAI